MQPFDDLRKRYDVPAKRLGRVRLWTGEEGTITGARPYGLDVRLDDGYRMAVHPANGVEYLPQGVKT